MNNEEITDGEIVKQVLAGNIHKYSLLVSRYEKFVFSFLLSKCSDVYEIEDVVQETFARLWKRHKDVDGTKAKSYIFTTAYHLVIDRTRKSQETLFDEKHDALQTIFRQYNGIKETLDEAVAKLPTDQRSVIMLRDYEGYSYEEIAKITGLTLSQVKVYIFRGRTFLRRQLENQGIYSANLEDAV